MFKGRVVVALYNYQGSEFGDMTFSKGDQMEIVDDTDPDWYWPVPMHDTTLCLVKSNFLPSQVGGKAHNKWRDRTHPKVGFISFVCL